MTITTNHLIVEGIECTETTVHHTHPAFGNVIVSGVEADPFQGLAHPFIGGGVIVNGSEKRITEAEFISALNGDFSFLLG